SETSSISSLMSVNVRMTIKTSGTSLVFLRISELVQPVLVDAEVVGELVEPGDADILFQILRVGKRPDERAPEDRDLVRQVLVGLPEPEEVRVVRVLLFDHDRHVLQRGGEAGRQPVQRLA